MQFIDLKAQYDKIQSKIQQRMAQVFEHSQYIMGPEINELEAALDNYVGSKHCITVSSGTDALLIALMALNIGPGDEVITTPFSFIATASMTRFLGAKPVFVDIDPYTYNINPELIEQAITAKTKVILPVDLYGQCADYDAINAIAKKHDLYVVQDAAQSFGSSYKGRKIGELATISCTSFFPSKPLGCYGDGGACFTNDEELATRMRQIRNHGQDRRYHHVRMGINGRMDTLQAAILLAKLEIFPLEMQKRQEIAQFYNSFLAAEVTTPFIEAHNISNYAQYTIQSNHRDQLIQALQQHDIPTAVHYPLSIHQQPSISRLNGDVHYNLPCAQTASNTVLSLPFHPYLAEEEAIKIATVITSYLQNIEEREEVAVA